MIMVALLLLAVDRVPLQTTLKGPSVSVPPEMVSHFETYANCVEERARADPRMPAVMEVARLVQADARASCADVRNSVAEASEKALARSGKYGDKKRRQAIVEATLAASERASDALIDMMASLPDPKARGVLPGSGLLDVEVPNAIVGLHNEYVRCQDQNLGAQRVRSREAFQAEVERAIAACASQKAALKLRAEVVLSAMPEYADSTARQKAIAGAFDGYDRTRRLMARGVSR